MPIRVLMLASTLTLLAACGTTGPAASALASGTEVEFEGRLQAVDTAPWAYDGNAKLVVDSNAHGEVTVELPARYNLCKAPGIGEAGTFSAGDRVRVAGTVTAASTVSVCERATHRIERVR